MNIEKTRSLILIMQAWCEGRPVQFHPGGDSHWQDANTDDLSWTEVFDWRIKPEPMEIEVWVDKDGNPTALVTLLGGRKDSWTKKKFREVV
jgi:hypothetical protein